MFNKDGQLISIAGANGAATSGTAAGFSGTLAGGSDLALGAAVTSGSSVVGYNPYASLGGWAYHTGTCSISAFYTVTFPPQPVAQYMYFNRECYISSVLWTKE